MRREQTDSRLDAGCLILGVTEAFLSEMDSEGIRRKLEGRIKSRQRLTEEEMIEYIILPLAYKDRSRQAEETKKAV